MSFSHIAIVTPTYKEFDNIELFVESVQQYAPGIIQLIVDDYSNDGMSQKILNLQKKWPHLFFIQRHKKEGLGPAYREGFDWILKSSDKYSIEYVVQMDADLSHRPEDLVKLISVHSGFDFVIGSRLVDGGEIKNWPWLRRCISFWGNQYAQFVLSRKIKDWTSGFNIWKISVLKSLPLHKMSSQGYSFQIEMKWSALRLNFTFKEVPIVFVERKVGKSKMNYQIILEAMIKVVTLRFRV